MRGRIWQSAFGMAVLIHLVVLSALGYALRESLREEIQYIEVTLNELFTEPPGSQPPGGGQQTKVNQDNMSEQKAAQVLNPVDNVAAPAQENAAEAFATPAYAQNSANVSTENAGTGNNAIGSGIGSGSGTGTGSGSGSGTGSGTGTGQGAGRGSKRNPHVISGSRPAYPAIARENGWEGTVSVQVLVSTAGTVQEVRIAASSGHDSLDQAVVGDMRRWRFSPALNNEGYPVAAWVTLPVRFDLTE